MTKARDLAGFSTNAVTTTTADGLILKGDGSSTDVVIKNGADATVASVADGTVNIAAAGSITATGASVGALARGAIQVGNSSGVAAALAKGTSGYVLTAGANDLSWAEAGGGATEHISTQTASSGAAYITFTNYLSSSYSNYILSFDLLKNNGANGNYQTIVQVSADGGSNWLTATSSYTAPDADAYYGLRVDGGTAAEGGGANSQGVSGFVYLYALGAAANTASFTLVVTPQYNSSYGRMGYSSGTLQARTISSASAHNAIRIAVNGSSGTSTFISGKVSLLGVKNS